MNHADGEIPAGANRQTLSGKIPNGANRKSAIGDLAGKFSLAANRSMVSNDLEIRSARLYTNQTKVEKLISL